MSEPTESKAKNTHPSDEAGSGLEAAVDEDNLENARENLEKIEQTIAPFAEEEGSFEAEQADSGWRNANLK